MNKTLVKRYTILGTLFFLPVIFLLFMYPAQHNYSPLDILEEHIPDIVDFSFEGEQSVQLEGHITILGFTGTNPQNDLIGMSNLKEMMYDKFKGFKKFQVVMIAPEQSAPSMSAIRLELGKYEDLKYWHFVFGDEIAIKRLYESLDLDSALNEDLSTDEVVIIDKELNLRGRLDDRSDNELSNNTGIYQKKSYDCIEVAELKNKMSEDLRILFTEYRQKRNGNFNSTTRRASDLKQDYENN